MSKAPRTEFPGSLMTSEVHGPVMAYAGHTEAVRMMAEAMSRFDLTSDELAKMLKCPASVLLAANIASYPRVSDRLRNMLAVLTRLSELTKDDKAALAWYESEAIPAFGFAKASEIVAKGHGSAVLDYLDTLAVGGFA